MSWTCPACQNAIKHSTTETTPHSGVTYRCPICRLELIVDPDKGKMVLAPMRANDDHEIVTSPPGGGRKAGDASQRSR